MIRKAIKLILILVWMGFIFSFSNDNATVSTRKSDGVIVKSVQFFMGRQLNDKEKEKIVNMLVVPVRKGAHFMVYLILGLLILSFINEFSVVQYKALLLAIVLSFLYACSDEVHQLFIPGRSGEVLDVIIDTTGAFVGCFLYLGVNKISNKERVYE